MAGDFHRLVISIISYLDDWLVLHPDHQVLSFTLPLVSVIEQLDLVGVRAGSSAAYPVFSTSSIFSFLDI